MNSVNDRVLPPTDDSDEAMTEYGRQLAMDVILEALAEHENGTEARTPVAARPSRRKPKIFIFLSAAACLLIGMLIWLNHGPSNPEDPVEHHSAIPGPGPAPAKGKFVELAPGWEGESRGAEYEVAAPGSVRLDAGELYIRSAPMKSTAATRGSLSVQTPNGTATASGTEFYVEANNPDNKDENMRSLTRVLVLSGVVTLANTFGTVSGEANDLLIAEADKAPVKQTVKANADFGIDLYRQLAKAKPGRNIFFSPYSVSSALAMTVEGARGETAAEMAKVLRYPDSALTKGGLSRSIAQIHTGFRSINQMLNRNDKNPRIVKIRKELATLRKELAAKKTAIRKAEESGPWKVVKKLAREEKVLIKRFNLLAAQVDKFELNVANAIWAEKTCRIEKDFRTVINRHYTSNGLQMADFLNQPDVERRRINKWVEGHTKDRIKDLIPENGLSQNTKLALVNAIYFKGEWATPFKPKNTKPGTFTLTNGAKQKVDIMQGWLSVGRYGAFNADGSFFKTPKMINSTVRTQPFPIYPSGGFLVAELPYKGDEVSMVLIAPMRYDGLENVEKQLSSAKINGWLERLERRDMKVKLPKFKLETNYGLGSSLRALGMNRAFTPATAPNGADFTGMHQTDILDKRLFIGSVLHKAFLEVNEKGTEAAAATVVMVTDGAEKTNMVPFVPEFRADRPFLLLIRHRPTGAILFMGRVNNPAPDQTAAAAAEPTLDGAWEITGGTQDGRKIDLSRIKVDKKKNPAGKLMLLFNGNSAYTFSPNYVFKEKFTSNDKEGVRHVDVGDKKGIYRLDGDRLLVTFGHPGKARPTKLNAGPVTMELTRMKATEKQLATFIGAHTDQDRARNEKLRRVNLGPVQKAMEDMPKINPPALEKGSHNAALKKHLLRIKNTETESAEALEITGLVAWAEKNKLIGNIEISLSRFGRPLVDEELYELRTWRGVKLLIWGKSKTEDTFAEEMVTFKNPGSLLRLIPLTLPTQYQATGRYKEVKARKLMQAKLVSAWRAHNAKRKREANGLPASAYQRLPKTGLDKEAQKIERFLASLTKRNYPSVHLAMRCPQLSDEDVLALSTWGRPKLYLSYGDLNEPVIHRETFTCTNPTNALRLIPYAIKTKNGVPVGKK